MKNVNEYQSIPEKADQLVRYYRIPVSSEKEQVLNTILIKIKDGEKSKTKSARKISLGPIVSIAAAASVALLIGFYFFTATVTFSGRQNENLAYRLPDDSRVVLQNESEIQIRKYFWDRKVNLIGAAYFEVEKGDDFQVLTGFGSVEVLGTRFLVSELDDSLNVQCYEGKVKASIKSNSVILVPGTRFSGTKVSAQKEEVEASPEYPDFARFNKKYSKTKLKNITAELEQFFGVEIKVQNGAERNFSGSIQTGKLDGALEIVCESMQLKYKYQENNKIVIFK